MSNKISLGYHDDRHSTPTERDFQLSILENYNRPQFDSLPKNSQYWLFGIGLINAVVFTHYRYVKVGKPFSKNIQL